MNEQKRMNPLKSLTAGMIAGSIEATITYPTEYVKTQLQLPGSNKLFTGPIDCLKKTITEKGIRTLYSGLSPMILGTAAKAGIRFVVYDSIKDQLRNKNGSLSFGNTVLAGLMAGLSEAFLVVTPAETIKTKLIQDQNSKIKQYNGMIHGVKSIIKSEGLIGIYRGVVPVMLRQGSNSAIRLTSYQILKDYCYKHSLGISKDEKNLTIITTFLLGMIAGTITVYTTMPIDNVKTKMQSKEASLRYKNSYHCLIQTVKETGVLSLWNGATPRLGRLLLSGGIVFSVYEQVIKFLN
ncbi:citrate transporter [Neoconidiobolus thromboides FSU 785]|nr:citrate transporter [Neoconidiobolus thromboides FSU 785]